MADDLRHGIAANIGILKHKAVAGVIAKGLNSRDQLVVKHPRGSVLELSHALVEQVDKVLDAIWHWRVGGKTRVAWIAPFGSRALACTILEIDRLCLWNDLRQYLDFLGNAWSPTEECINDLLEIEQPKRQAQISWREHLGLGPETASVFIVRIDQENA